MAHRAASPSHRTSTDEQNRIERLLRKSLLGSEIIDTQFYLFSTRSVSSDGVKVTRPRVLCVNNVLLSNSSKYFSDLLRSTTPSDGSIEIIDDDRDVPGENHIDDYGYGSDSDLEDEFPSVECLNVSLPPEDIKSEDNTGVWSELFEDRPRSVASDIFILNPEEDRKELDREQSSSNVAVQDACHDAVLVRTTALNSQNARRILVKDTAFQTWYALLYYLYTGKVTFSPLKSANTPRTLSGPLEAPKCSAKSMYRLARKVGLKSLRDEALEFLRDNITEQNILKELTSSLLSESSSLLEMTLDVLYANIASRPVVTGFPALAKRIARREVPHGADIITGLHVRLLKKHHSDALPEMKLAKGRVTAGGTNKKKGSMYGLGAQAF